MKKYLEKAFILSIVSMADNFFCFLAGVSSRVTTARKGCLNASFALGLLFMFDFNN